MLGEGFYFDSLLSKPNLLRYIVMLIHTRYLLVAPKQSFHCKLCGNERYLLDLTKAHAQARRCDDKKEGCFKYCDMCDNNGVLWLTDEKGYSFVTPCNNCGSLNQRIQKFNLAQIPSRYFKPEKGRTLASYAALYKDANGVQIGNLKIVHGKLNKWVNGYTPGGKGFLLHGSVGTGKTRLLCLVLRELTLEKSITCRFVEFSHLLGELKAQFDRGLGVNAILEKLVKLDVLAIDELGKSGRTEWELSILDELVSKRYNSGGTTLFTTNQLITPPKTVTAAQTNQTLEERVQIRIFSRLQEMTEFIEVDARDFRKTP